MPARIVFQSVLREELHLRASAAEPLIGQLLAGVYQTPRRTQTRPVRRHCTCNKPAARRKVASTSCNHVPPRGQPPMNLVSCCVMDLETTNLSADFGVVLCGVVKPAHGKPRVRGRQGRQAVLKEPGAEERQVELVAVVDDPDVVQVQ